MPAPPDPKAFIAQHGAPKPTKKKTNKAAPKVVNTPWAPLSSPLPSLVDIKAEAHRSAMADMNALLAAIPKPQTYKDQSALAQKNIQGITGAAQGLLGNIQTYGVNQGNVQNQGVVAANAGAASAAGVAPTDLAATGITDLLGKGVANQANYMGSVQSSEVARGQAEGFAQQAELEKQLKDIEDAKGAVRAKRPELEHGYFDKLKEFYLGIQGAQQQTRIAEAELKLKAGSLALGQDQLTLATGKAQVDAAYKQGQLELGANRNAIAQAKLELSQGTQNFNQWLQRQKLDIQKKNLGLRKKTVQLAIDKAKETGVDISAPALNQVFNLIDKQIMAVNTTPGGKKVTSYNYVFYAYDPVAAEAGTNPIKSFKARGKDFNEAWTNAHTIASQKNLTLPASRAESPIPPEDRESAVKDGYDLGPAFREERIEPKESKTEGTVTSKFTKPQVYNMALTRLVNLGLRRDKASQLARQYIESMYGSVRDAGITPRT